MASFLIVLPFSWVIYPDFYPLNPVSFLFISFAMEIVDPAQIPNWDEILLRTPGYSFFHSSSWARVLKESYNYTPNYFAEIKDGHFSILVPIMEVNSLLTGKRGVSLPFTDWVDPIVREGISFQELFKQILAFGRKRGWKYFELRGGGGLFPHAPTFITYLGHGIDLSKKEEVISNFRDSTRRNIKKAASQGILVKIHYDLDAVKKFSRLNSMTRKIHGLPPQPESFFKRIYEHIISKNYGFVILAYYQDKAIASGMYFQFGQKVIYKYGASDKDYQHLRANNAVMWEAIKSCCRNGIQGFNFGRTEPGNKGLLQFKRGWGTFEDRLHYYKYDLKRNHFQNGRSGRGIFYSIFRHLPTPVLKIAGKVLYKHAG